MLRTYVSKETGKKKKISSQVDHSYMLLALRSVNCVGSSRDGDHSFEVVSSYFKAPLVGSILMRCHGIFE
jgi:hypothetical protein